jgi:hypothetical protein
MSIFVYADDIILLSPYVSLLQKLIRTREDEFMLLDMHLDAVKSNCIRFGPRYGVTCAALTLRDGSIIPWVNKCLYLGKTLQRSKYFKCDFENEKRLYTDRSMVYLAKPIV